MKTEKQIWTITPEKAQALLDTNPDNRSIRPSKVAQYARDMASGNWSINGHEISLSENGKLLDGQHRMMAVIASGSTVDFWMALNVPETTQFDVGAPRSAADSIHIGRTLNNQKLATNKVVALANAFFRVMYGSSKARQMTNADRALFINNNENAICFVLDIIGANGAPMNRGVVMASLLAADMCGVSRALLSTFAEEVNSGFVYSDSHTAASVLRTMLIEARFSAGGSQMQQSLASVTCQAIADYVAGRGRRNRYQPGKKPYFDDLERRGWAHDAT